MENKNLSEVEEIRKYVREVLMKNYPESSDILPPEVKHELKRETTKLRPIFVSLMKNIEDEKFEDTTLIDSAVRLLNYWKTKIEKVIS